MSTGQSRAAHYRKKDGAINTLLNSGFAFFAGVELSDFGVELGASPSFCFSALYKWEIETTFHLAVSNHALKRVASEV